MKTVLFIPGGTEDWNSRDYASVMKTIEQKGYKVRFVPIQWKRSTIDDWVHELMTVYARYDPAQTILAGFSWGAMTVFIAATQRQPAELWLCSLSPYFSDDKYLLAMQHAIPKWLGKHRFEAFARLDFDALAQTITIPTTILVGEYELASVKKRCQVAAQELANARLITVQGAKHEVDDPNYLAAILAL